MTPASYRTGGDQASANGGADAALSARRPCGTLRPGCPVFDLFSEFNQVVRAFRRTRVKYAVVGGLAVTVHGYVRATEDMDILVHPKDLARAGVALRGLGYAPMAPPWSFSNSRMTLHRFFRPARGGTEDFYVLDVLVPDDDAGLDVIRRAARLKWSDGSIRVAREQDLIDMKRKRGSAEDLLDIKHLEAKIAKKTHQGRARH